MSKSKFDKNGEVIHYIAEEIPGLTKPQLIKLVYLTDREFYKKYGQKITNFEYYMYFYGPYCNEYEYELDSLIMKNLIRYETLPMGYRVYGNKKIPYSLNMKEKETINHVLENAIKHDLLESSRNMRKFIYRLEEVKSANPLKDISFKDIEKMK